MIETNPTYSLQCNNCGNPVSSPRLREVCYCSENCKWEAEKNRAEKARQLLYKHFLKLYEASTDEERKANEEFRDEMFEEIFDEYVDQGSLRKTLTSLGMVAEELKLDLKKIHAIVILKKFEYKERLKKGYSGNWSMEKIGYFQKPLEINSI